MPTARVNGGGDRRRSERKGVLQTAAVKTREDEKSKMLINGDGRGKKAREAVVVGRQR